MNRIDRKDLPASDSYEGCCRLAFGRGGAVEEDEAKMGFITVTAAAQPAAVHRHETEVMYIEDAKGAFLCWGKAPDALTNKAPLEPGHIFCTGGDDWHRVVIEDPDGFASYVLFTADGDPAVALKA